MANNSTAGCGGWKAETLESEVKTFVGAFKGKANPNLAGWVRFALTTAATEATLPDGTKVKSVPKFGDGSRPAGIEDTEWPKVLALLNQCVQIRTDNWPWGKANTVKIGARAYHESY